MTSENPPSKARLLLREPLLHFLALGAALVVAIRVSWGRIAVREAGSWIAAVGLLLFVWSLRRA